MVVKWGLLVWVVLIVTARAESPSEKPGWQPDPKEVAKWKTKRRPGINYDESLVPKYELPDPLKTVEGNYVYNPSPDTIITTDDKLFVIGTTEQIQQLINEVCKPDS